MVVRFLIGGLFSFILVSIDLVPAHSCLSPFQNLERLIVSQASGDVLEGTSTNQSAEILRFTQNELTQTERYIYGDFFFKLLLFFCFLIITSIILVQNKNLRKRNFILSKQESLYRSVIEDQIEVICRFNTDFTITFVNDAFCDLIKREKKDLIGKGILDFLPIEDHKLVFNTIAQLTPKTPETSIEYLLNVPEENSTWHQWTIRAIVENDTIREYQANGRDINDLKKVNETLIHTMEEVEEANRAKSDFLARMSHELRTPLNSVIGFASILLKNKQNNLSGRDINFISRILTNGNHLLELINQILDLSKIESGRMDVHLKPIHLNQLIWDIISQMEDQIRSKGITINSDIPEYITPIKTDEGKLKQILINLIGNAIKFTEKGSVTIHIESQESSHKPQSIEIIDSGIGIPESRLSNIFEPFQQADSGTSRQFGGTGLGLTISKSLCQLLGFELEVESRVGEGSCFRILLHANRADSTEIADEYDSDVMDIPSDERKNTHGNVLHGKTILIIDDEQDARFLLKHTVEEFGCDAITAVSGVQGIEIALKNRPDLILMDVLMPEMNGWEVLIALKSDPVLCVIPVVIVSIVASDLKNVSLGVVDLVDKPVDPDALYQVVCKNILKKRGNVLLVETNESEIKRIVPFIENEGLNVVSARSEADAVKCLKIERFDLILIDCDALINDQNTILNKIHHFSESDRLPVIVTITDKKTFQPNHVEYPIDGVLFKENGFEQELKSSLQKIFQND